jgi:hypothetical protein
MSQIYWKRLRSPDYFPSEKISLTINLLHENRPPGGKTGTRLKQAILKAAGAAVSPVGKGVLGSTPGDLPGDEISCKFWCEQRTVTSKSLSL